MIPFLSILIFLFSICIQAQVTDEWVQRFNSNRDSAVGIVTDSKENIYITGIKNNPNPVSDPDYDRK